MDVSPLNQNIAEVFSSTTYYIDFYQRDYRWTDKPVLQLLDDIFFKFEEQYARSIALDASKENITENYPWYYLNTYVTNNVKGRTYVVDGQQRLTTLTLILIKLRHLAIHFDSKLEKGLESKIGGQEDFEYNFWMNHVGHKATQKGLFDGDDLDSIPTHSGETARNMVENYKTISTQIDNRLKDKKCFETFVFYFLYRLVLINLKVDQTDVAMVFEVINDRGVQLRPYEILKGKLLGQIDKDELDRGGYNQIWEKIAGEINDGRPDEMDAFFRFFLKSKFADTQKEGQKFDKDYHREMFSAAMDQELGLLHNPSNVKAFLKEDFVYYTRLYLTLLKNYGQDQNEYRGLLYNGILDLDAPFHLVLSACTRNDPNEKEKIKLISNEIDRFHTLLQLQNAYRSNDFSSEIYKVSAKIRNTNLANIRPAFDEVLTGILATSRGVDKADAFSYAAFSQTGTNLSTRFIRYFFARIDEYLAKETKQNLRHSVWDLSRRTGPVNGFHIEHILARNSENLQNFGNNEERFEQQRNRLGGLLLLKGRDNQSSNDEVYAKKLMSYANTLLWNETLRADTYKSKLDLRDYIARSKLDMKPLAEYGPDEVESRHRLLFQLTSLIWD